MAETKETHEVRPAEGALAPSLMDVPRTAAAAAAMPTTATRVDRGAALLKAPRRPAAPDLCVLVAEGADVVRLAEGPAPSVEQGGLQADILPSLTGRLRVAHVLCVD